jgi:hypothetical protein
MKIHDYYDYETNRRIKSLLLEAIKARHSTLFSVNKAEIYTEEYCKESEMDNDAFVSKSTFVSIDTRFMDSLKRTGENEYKVEIQLNWPDDWRYYFTVVLIDNRCFISSIEVDP